MVTGRRLADAKAFAAFLAPLKEDPRHRQPSPRDRAGDILLGVAGTVQLWGRIRLEEPDLIAYLIADACQ